jgi:predicted Rossmann fold flavoprotein
MSTTKDVIIIGAGASGLMCAIAAGRRGRSVLVLEHNEKPGKKIRASGGGRCNFTNINIQADNYISNNRNFCKSALSRFTPSDFMRRLDIHDIRYYEKEKGRMFCEKSSAEIIRMLQDECAEVRVEMLFNCRISEIEKKDSFVLSTNRGGLISDSLVIATGGISYPDLGATDIGYQIAKKFGLRVVPPKPSLVPLVFSRENRKIFNELSGVSINSTVSCNKRDFTGNILFTHNGLSGPAILQISSYWNNGDDILINLLPEIDAHQLFISKKDSKVEMKNLLAEYLPKRFAFKWSEMYILSKPIYQYNDKELRSIAYKLHNWIVRPETTEGYNKAEVTSGGVDTNELSSKTMESKKVKGLYFIGEVIDVTGHLGGYNLQWAWSSGHAAGQCA